ncbi:MAG: Zn-dependent exopeptidase M28 [Ruminococcaceae bacterium]|nr:Zn-dependent exopeptidase M28 [Oscillospiraceae bacterium]
MIEKPMDVLAQFPVRKSEKQKSAFRKEVWRYLQGLGYKVTVEQGSMGVKNVVIGNPDSAKYLITAHYDTPACIGLPNILTPCNPIVFIGWQVLLVAVILAAAILPGVLLGFVFEDPVVAGNVSALMYWLILILMLAGPANKRNANDNTSGVVTVLETAAAWPKEKRDLVCFVLFDLEEAGLIGSAAYRKAHKAATKNQIVLNLDCVGDGDEILLVAKRKLKKDPEKLALLRSFNGSRGSKKITLHEKGFVVYPSDQQHYPYGVGIAAFRRVKGIGLYVGRIHTARDTILDEKNVNYLRDTLLTLADVNAAQ